MKQVDFLKFMPNQQLEIGIYIRYRIKNLKKFENIHILQMWQPGTQERCHICTKIEL